DWAVKEAARRDADLRVLHVAYVPVIATPFVGGAYYPTVEELGEIAGPILSAAAERAARVDPSVPVRTALRSGPPAEALLDEAKDADLVVVGSRGLGSVGSMFFGSVGARLAARSPVPVVVVPPVADAGERTTDVVVGVDGSVHGDAALRFALDEAARTGGRVVAVCAWRLPVGPLWEENPAFYTAVERDARAEASRTVEAALARVRSAEHADVLVETFVVDREPSVALRVALDEAARTGGRVVAVCAWRLPVGPLWEENPAFYTAVERDARAEASRTVEAALARVRSAEHADVLVETFVVDREPSVAI